MIGLSLLVNATSTLRDTLVLNKVAHDDGMLIIGSEFKCYFFTLNDGCSND